MSYKKHVKGPWDRDAGKCPCGCWDDRQHKNFELLDHFEGDEKKVNAYIASRLREAADQCEAGGFPMVFGADVPMPGEKLLGDSFIGSISVTLSYPWPG